MVTPTDGGVVYDFTPGAAPAKERVSPDEFDANLAEFLSETAKNAIATDVIRWVEADLESRSNWFNKLAKGLEVLGIVPDSMDLGPLKLAKEVTHPLLVEAAVQFQSRAISELVPPNGPAKAQVLGKKTVEKEDSAQRVADFLNYSLMVKDKEYFPQTDSMMFVLSYEGSQFKKVYRDPILRRPVSRWVKAEAFVVPYDQSSLESSPRYAHIYPLEHNDLLKMQENGFYTDDDIGQASTRVSGLLNSSRLKDKRDQAQGQEEGQLPEDAPHIIVESHCLRDLDGFEDVGADGEKTGIALPYVAHVEYDSKKVLGIYRNWKEEDQDKTKRVWFVHYPFVPGDGFYSYGNLHLAGGLAAGCTGALRILVIGSLFASMPGGFKTKEGKRITGQVELQAGVYQDIDANYDDLAKAFYSPAFKEPSEALFKTLGLMVDSGHRLFSTQDTNVGDASNTGPVGTTVALIEEGKRVFSAIHKRLHVAQGVELQLLKDLHGEWIPDEGYPYDVPGENRQVFAEDFGPHTNIVPVSDPNIFSTTQRMAIAQAVSQDADAHPEAYHMPKVRKMFLEAMKAPDPYDLLINRKNVQRCDPVTENALLTVGRPVRVFPDQDHKAHGVVHRTLYMQLMSEAKENPLAQQNMPHVLAHMAEHDATGARLAIAQQMGIELPPMDLTADPGEPVTEMLPPEVENQIAARAAQIMAKMGKPQSQEDLATKEQALAEQQQAMAQQQDDLKKQAEGLQKAGQQIQDEKKRLDQAKSDVERARMQAEHDREVAALQDQIAQLKALVANEKMQEHTRKVVEEAVAKVEAMLGEMGKDGKELAGA